MRTHIAAAVVLCALLLPVTSLASAAPQAAGQDAVTEMSEGPTLNPVEERRLRFLFWGYNVIWILLTVYLVSLWMRLGSVQRELRQLRVRIEARDGAAPASTGR